MKQQSTINTLFGIYLVTNMFLAILAVPYFAALLLSGYIQYVNLDWLLLVGACDIAIFAGFESRLDA